MQVKIHENDPKAKPGHKLNGAVLMCAVPIVPRLYDVTEEEVAATAGFAYRVGKPNLDMIKPASMLGREGKDQGIAWIAPEGLA